MGSAHARAPGILTPLSLFFCRTRHAQATTPPQSVVLTGAVQALRAPDSPRMVMQGSCFYLLVIMFIMGPRETQILSLVPWDPGSTPLRLTTSAGFSASSSQALFPFPLN